LVRVGRDLEVLACGLADGSHLLDVLGHRLVARAELDRLEAALDGGDRVFRALAWLAQLPERGVRGDAVARAAEVAIQRQAGGLGRQVVDGRLHEPHPLAEHAHRGLEQWPDLRRARRIASGEKGAHEVHGPARLVGEGDPSGGAVEPFVGADSVDDAGVVLAREPRNPGRRERRREREVADPRVDPIDLHRVSPSCSVP
jgi:hypothetical protein